MIVTTMLLSKALFEDQVSVRYLVLTKGKCAIVSNLLYFDRANDKNRNNFVRPFFEYKLEKSSNIYSWLIQMKVPSN